MANQNKLLFDVKYQTLLSGEDLKEGEAVKLDANGHAVKVSAVGDWVYGVVFSDADDEREVTVYKAGGSSEVLVKAAAAAYAFGDKLAVTTSGSFEKTTTDDARFSAVAIEGKTTTAEQRSFKGRSC